MRVDRKERYQKVRRVAQIRNTHVRRQLMESKNRRSVVQKSIADTRLRFKTVLCSVQGTVPQSRTPKLSLVRMSSLYAELVSLKKDGMVLTNLSRSIKAEQGPLKIQLQGGKILVSVLDEKVESIQQEVDDQLEIDAQDELSELQTALLSVGESVERAKPDLREVVWQESLPFSDLTEDANGKHDTPCLSLPGCHELENTQRRMKYSTDCESLREALGEILGVSHVAVEAAGNATQISFDFRSSEGKVLSVQLNKTANNELKLLVIAPGMQRSSQLRSIQELERALGQQGFTAVHVRITGGKV